MYAVATRDDIREWVLVHGHSQRSAAKHFGMSRETVARLLAEPPEDNERRYRRKAPRPAPVREVMLPRIEAWLAENVRLPPLRAILIWDNLAGHLSWSIVRWLFQHGVMPLYTPLSGSWPGTLSVMLRVLRAGERTSDSLCQAPMERCCWRTSAVGRNQTATGARLAKAERRVWARGRSASHAATRRTFRAVAMRRCKSRVFGRPR